MQTVNHIYPLDLPPIEVEGKLDWLLIEPPPRYLPMMPNGVGYVYNLLKRLGQRVQVLDLNIHLYHEYHSERFLSRDGAPPTTSSGYSMVPDPWATDCGSEFGKPEVINHFWPFFQSVLEQIAVSRPKVIGLSINGDNTGLAQRLIEVLRKVSPESIIVLGGYICIYSSIGPHVIRDYDYMVIGEAEMALPALVEAISKRERPRDLPGIISRWDFKFRGPVESLLPEDIDAFGFPKYEWIDLGLYQTWEGRHLVPVCGSRGCNWSRCRFCGECISYRIRQPSKVVDEIEYFYKKGLRDFHFNESDVNGDSQNLYNICAEIIKRGLKVNLLGQLRIHKKNTLEYFAHLRAAGFKHLRFGVDGWTDNLLRLQKKGYTMRMVYQNLKDCHAAGIHTTVNIVLGVPGELEEDITELINNITSIKDYIDQVESFNTLALMANSEYYNNPDAYNIRFRGDRDEIYARHRNMIPPELWYSEEPYIDQDLRIKRLDRIVECLYLNGVSIGSFAQKVIDNWQKNRQFLQLAPETLCNRIEDELHHIPRDIELIRELGDYNLVRVDDRFIALLKNLGPVDLACEKLGQREIWPYVIQGTDRHSLQKYINERGGNPDRFTYRQNANRWFGLSSELSKFDQALEDLLVWWQLSPYIYSGNSMNEVMEKLGISS